MRKAIIVLFVFSLISCKNEKSENTETQQATEQQAATNDFFRITLDVVAKKDDSFHVFYSEDKTLNFTEENSVWAEFKGNDAAQKLVFDLPKDRYPSQLRIDYGLNKDQGEIKINSLEISYKGKVKLISGADYFKYFTPNLENTSVDAGAQTVKALKSGKDFSGPSTYPLESLAVELENLMK